MLPDSFYCLNNKLLLHFCFTAKISLKIESLVTESDGAYKLQCIYMDGNQSLSAVLNVHGSQTTALQPSPLPTCKYEVKF